MKIDKTFTIKFENDNLGYLDAFGLESEHSFSPFQNLVLPDEPPIITHIVGESGSGKSQLTNILGNVWNFQTPHIPHDESICCEMLGLGRHDIDTMIYYLNYVGLSDARLYYTKFKYLSDSQKFRASLALTLSKHKCAEGYIFDEFLSTLDRETAKSIAFLIQKLVRKENIKVILTTAHTDLIDYLSPDLLLMGESFPERFIAVDMLTKPTNIDYYIQSSTKEEYKSCRLGELHYKAKYTGGAKEYLTAKTPSGKIIGFLVTAAVGKECENKRRIARVIVHPSYRGIGVGTNLVRSYINWAKESGIKKITAISALGMFNPFFDKAGMLRETDYSVGPKASFITQLRSANFNTEKWFSRDYCVSICDSIELRQIIATKANEAGRILNPGGKRLTEDEIRNMILSSNIHAGRYLWTLRPRTLAKYTFDI